MHWKDLVWFVYDLKFYWRALSGFYVIRTTTTDVFDEFHRFAMIRLQQSFADTVVGRVKPTKTITEKCTNAKKYSAQHEIRPKR